MKKEKSRFDALGDRMKKYEQMETSRILMPGLPIMVRLDGRGFSKFTRGMARPFHEPMSRAMIETARYLVEETHASFAYTQSDEITLGFWNNDPKHEALFGGRVQKLVSVYAGMATAKFMEQTMLRMPDRLKRLPVLDARVFNMPNLDEMAECVLFRALDCAKNSITMAASAYYPHKELHGKSGGDKHEMLHAKGINWAEYPEFFKNGTFLRRETATAEVSAERMARIPEKHRHLHTGKASRSSVVEVDMPPFARVANQVDVLFRGATPILRAPTAILAAA